MTQFSRREFMRMGGQLALAMGLGAGAAPRIAEGLEELAAGAAPVIWLQGQSCSGCSVSFLNSRAPSPFAVLTQYISLRFHSTLSTATGHLAMEVLHKSIEAGGHFLVVEGAIPAGMPRACVMGEEPMADLVKAAAQKAKAVVAVGTCASFGGIPAAENNPTGAMGAPAFLQKEGIATPAIRLPGCPAHPDWLVGTLAHVLKVGLPELDKEARPVMFYGRLIHDQCPRFSDYERERFAAKFSDDGCLFKLGCLGVATHADCTYRHWNRGANTCIKAGAPCIGCASPAFAAKADLPFYLKGVASVTEGA